MTTLFRQPVATMSAGRIVGLAALGFATLALLGLTWWTFSPILGRVYAGVRLAESALLWQFTDWGRYFTGMPAGRPFAFVSIYKSSVGFGLVATLVTALLGTLAWRRRTRNHMEVLITAAADGFSQKSILQAYAPPHRLVSPPVAKPEAEAGEPIAADAVNPFMGLRDLRDVRAVETVMDCVAWHHAAALFLTIDAVAPLRDRKARAAVLKGAWTVASRFTAAPGDEPSAAALAALHGYLLAAITDRSGRVTAALDEVHAALGSEDTLNMAIAQLASRALAEGGLFFPDFAWLRHVDPTLQATITSY